MAFLFGSFKGADNEDCNKLCGVEQIAASIGLLFLSRYFKRVAFA